MLVRAEVALSGLVSEMRVDDDGTVALFLDRSRTELRVDLDGAPRNSDARPRCSAQWRGHEQLIAMLDMTTPGQAVMRLRTTAPRAAARSAGAVRRVVAADARGRCNPCRRGRAEMRNVLTGIGRRHQQGLRARRRVAAEGGGATVLGYGVAPCTGLRKGVVVNIEATVEAIRAAVDEAEKTSGVRVGAAVVGVAGAHIRGLNSHGIVAVRGGEVSARDVERVIDAARAVAIPLDRQVLHILPQQFAVDDQEGVRDPVGMAGVRLEARIHIVTAAQSYGQNLTKCCERAGVTPSRDGVRAARLGRRGAVSRGARTRRRADRHRRRHHRHHRFSRRRGDAYRGAADRRQSSDQRRRRGTAHAARRRRAAQDQLRRRDQLWWSDATRRCRCRASADASRA